MQFFTSAHYDFIGRRRSAYALSISLIVIGLVGIGIRKGLNFGIDFKGGTSVILEFKKDVNAGDLRSAFSGSELGNVEIKKLMTTGTEIKNEVLIYIQQQKNLNPQQAVDKVEETIRTAKPDLKFERIQFESVGPKVGKELRANAVLAVLISLLLILIYIGFRFELSFAVCAVIALFHDVIITLGLFNLLNFELSLKEIAAFLTLVGYSINDTIVVYDRIRENLRVMRSEGLDTIINKSINSTLSRTVMTSFTTFVAVLALFLLGGTVIRGFAFIMLIGVITGTYSSIFVASPLILEWQNRHGGKMTMRLSKRRT